MDWLVFRLGEDIEAYKCFAQEAQSVHRVTTETDDPVEAAKIVLGVTGRIARYAVIPACVVDLRTIDGFETLQLDFDPPHR